MQVAESEAGSNSASLSAKRASVANRSVHVRHAGWDFVDAVRKHPSVSKLAARTPCGESVKPESFLAALISFSIDVPRLDWGVVEGKRQRFTRSQKKPRAVLVWTNTTGHQCDMSDW